MHLGQIKWNGATTAAIFNGTAARPIPDYTLLDLIGRAEKECETLPEIATRLATRQAVLAEPLIPLQPREVWGCGCTYETSATFRDADQRDAEQGTREGFYAHVYKADRPEIFFKGTARVCVGPGQPIGIRGDSKFTAPEPELALVLGAKGKILGYTLANDVSAWDIERENPLYLPQSKTYTACCALGPVIVTVDEIADARALHMTCTVRRGSTEIFSGETPISRLGRTFETLVEYLLRSNPVPAGSVVLTGTGIIVKEDAALAAGDIVTIRIPEIGELSNPCAIV
jgi:2-dehydro-3-deoxy-D-arabinonate dehydratase